jgi:hypothetical protein
MIFSKRMMFLNILLLVLSAALLWVSCDTGNGNVDTTPGLYDNDPAVEETAAFTEGAGYTYPEAALNVDYNGDNNAVFFDFSTGSKTVLPHDFFDIAILGSMSDAIIIANSGSYGSGVQVYKTDSTNIAADFSSLEASVKEYTFKPTLPVERLYGHQSEVNPLGSLATTESNVCLIKVNYNTEEPAVYFKVRFGMTMEGGPPTFNMTVVPGLGAGEAGKVELKPSVSGITGAASYGWLYFKLVGTGGPRNLNTATALAGGAPAIPKAADWDILATRTNELQTEDGTTLSAQMPVASRSSILLNVFEGVKAGVVSKTLIDAVPASSSVPLRIAVDTIGYGWYSMGTGMPSPFSVAGNTYIIKTAEDKFAKFQPESFYGDNGKSFGMDFSYYYQE